MHFNWIAIELHMNDGLPTNLKLTCMMFLHKSQFNYALRLCVNAVFNTSHFTEICINRMDLNDFEKRNQI